MIDWVLAEWIAWRVAGRGDAPWPEVDLGPLAIEAERRVVEYTGLVPAGPLPPPEGIGRREWVASNIGSSRALLDPVVSRAGSRLGPAKPAAQLWMGAAVSTEVGVLMGYMAQRVLGQYELVLIEEAAERKPPRLLFVLPNLGHAVRKLEADEHEFLTWVTLHEVTHAVQFGAVDWLQPHLAGLVSELVRSAEQRAARRPKLRVPSREELLRLGRAARHADVIGLFASESERRTIDQAQAVMAVIEGHAEHVMDAVAPDLLPSLPHLRSALDSRRRNQSLVSRLIARLLGLELKLRQYERGKIFCDHVVDVGGRDALRYLFSSAEALPTLAEIDAPASWLERVGPAL